MPDSLGGKNLTGRDSDAHRLRARKNTGERNAKYNLPMLRQRAALLAAMFILITGCSRKATEQSKLPMATVTLDKKVVKFGDEVQIRIDNLPQAWSGEVLV